jgi:hypothetical protein
MILRIWYGDWAFMVNYSNNKIALEGARIYSGFSRVPSLLQK